MLLVYAITKIRRSNASILTNSRLDRAPDGEPDEISSRLVAYVD